MGKTTIYRYLINLLQNVRRRLETEEEAIVVKNCLLSDQTFEKMGELMSQNDCNAFGWYDELTNWPSQVNLYSGNKGLLDTHEVTKILEFFSGGEWTRQTGSCT